MEAVPYIKDLFTRNQLFHENFLFDDGMAKHFRKLKYTRDLFPNTLSDRMVRSVYRV